MTRKTTKERKKEIVEATLDLVGEKGIGSLGTSQIADRVGFSEAAIYKHFSSKKEVIRATIQTAGKNLIETLTGSIKNVDTDDNLVKLKKVFESHMKFIGDYPGITRLLFSDEIHFNEEDLRNDLFNIVTRYRSIIKDLLEQGIEKGQVRNDLDLDSAFTFYFGMIQSQILFWSLTGGEESLEDQASELWKLFRKLVAVRGA
ncbi:hypothetical protein AKJ49_01240 [candidate division MSBL1 archaeon SCGC-AAA382A03]|uniref:HTH tetR-type domain-containing protein n=1 Tax=candidate division MSBL1 archaeon SCGC-AAA382A03 TaxID=1698278 RepID=A0A133VFK1_9EURY|nr:hypothetical protein AKJ49_01240 [candidate division MSBL1 archaeon SCGC-AAA382A03]